VRIKKRKETEKGGGGGGETNSLLSSSKTTAKKEKKGPPYSSGREWSKRQVQNGEGGNSARKRIRTTPIPNFPDQEASGEGKTWKRRGTSNEIRSINKQRERKKKGNK